MKYLTSLIIALASITAVNADDIKPVGVIEPTDVQELSRIVDEELPPKQGRKVVAWINVILARQAAKDKAETEAKKAAEPSEK